MDLLFPVSWEQNDPQTCSQITLHLRADLGWKKCREAARSWKWGLGAKSAVNAGAQRSKEREAQLARKDDISSTIGTELGTSEFHPIF